MTRALDVMLSVEQVWHQVPGGSGTYVRELVSSLDARDDVRARGVAAWHREPPEGGALPVPVHRVPLPRRALYEAWTTLRAPRADRSDPRPDLVHATTWAVPGRRRAPLVATVHDVAFLREPGHFTPRGARWFRRALDIVRDEAAAVVVPSEATAVDCEAAGIERERTHVVPLGVRVPVVDDAARADWRRRRGTDRPYLLWCGTLEPRKNVPVLVEAYRRARAEGGLDHDLVLVGPRGWGDTAAAVDAAAAALPAGAVQVVGPVPWPTLHAAYAGATAFAFPSVWEGFGLPALEAMWHGLPVVTSAGTSMAEVVGPEDLLVDPADTDGLAEALVRAVASSGPARAEAARAHAAGFTWERAADATVAVYRTVVPG